MKPRHFEGMEFVNDGYLPDWDEMKLAEVLGPKGIVFHIDPNSVSSIAESNEGVPPTQTEIVMHSGDRFFSIEPAADIAKRING